MSSEGSLRRTKPRRFAWGLGIFAGLGVLALIAARLFTNSDDGFPPLPNPNGFDDLLRAGKMITGEVPGKGKSADASTEELTRFVEENAEALALIEEGLRKESRVRLHGGPEGIAAAVDDVSPIRQAGRLLDARGALLERTKTPIEAARVYLGEIRVGQAISRGGVMIHGMTGLALQGIGVRALQRLSPAFSADEAAEVLKGVDEIERGRTPSAEIFDMETRLSSQVHAFGVRLALSFSGAGAGQRLAAERAYLASERRESILLERLRISLARRIHVLKEGKEPSDISELRTKYLQTPLKYHTDLNALKDDPAPAPASSAK